MVKTPLGDIPIELIRAGDEVFAYNFESRQNVVRKVPAIYKNSTERILEIGIENETIRCTRVQGVEKRASQHAAEKAYKN